MKHRFFAAALALMCTLFSYSTAMAQNYPSRPVRMVVPFAPGGSTDLLARMLGDALGKVTGQPFVVENVGGAGATLGTARVAAAAPDGYTILFGSSSALVIAPHLYKLRYDPRTSFEPIGKVATASFVLMTRPDSDVDTFEKWVARARAAQGSLNYGSPGVGGAHHLTIERLMREIGIQAVHVPFAGSAPVYTTLIGGDIDFMIDSPSGAVPMVKAGKTVALAVTSRVRERDLPEVPTLQELGVRDFESMAWFAVMAPKGTAEPIVQHLKQKLAEVLRQPDVQAAMTRAGFNPVDVPETLAADIAREYERWGRVVEQVDVKLHK